ncbi:MAG: hypothetical protein M3044_14185 [Thermoproteota archaeon]|nr:hypothetical protein [Thermoproteota archaeon]
MIIERLMGSSSGISIWSDGGAVPLEEVSPSSDYPFNSIIVVALLSLILTIVSNVLILSVPYYTTELNAFAQRTPSQRTNEALINELASRLQNETGENTTVKPILEQIAAEIHDFKGNDVLQKTLANLTQAVKHPENDFVSQSIYRLSIDEAAGNVSSVDTAISRFAHQVGNGEDPKQLLMQTTVQLIGGFALNQNIEYIASQVENVTGAEHVVIKKILDLLTLQMANFKTKDAAISTINQIAGEIQKDPDGPISQSLSRLANNGAIFR